MLLISVVKTPDASEALTVNVSEVSVAVSSAALAADEPKVVNAYAPTDKVIASARQRVKSFFIFIFLPFRNFFIYSHQALFVMPAKNKTNLAKTLPGKAEPAELIYVFFNATAAMPNAASAALVPPKEPPQPLSFVD